MAHGTNGPASDDLHAGPRQDLDRIPRSLTWVTRSVLATIVVGAVTALLVVVQRDALLEAWSAGHPPDSTIQPLAFVPVALVLYVVFAGSALLMLAFLLGAHGWARYCLAAITLFVIVATVAGLRTNPPPAFVVVSVVGVVVEAATLVLLWHPGTSAFLREPVLEGPATARRD